MQYGTDYDLNVINFVNAANAVNPIERIATITLHRDMPYMQWKKWYSEVLKPELVNLNVEALNIQRSTANKRRLLSSIKYTLDKNKNLCKIVGVNMYRS